MANHHFWLIGPLPARTGQLQLHWLTPLEHGHCEFAAPQSTLAEVGQLRDRQRSAAIDDSWPKPVVGALRRLLSSTFEPVRIRLALCPAGSRVADEVVGAWHRTAFEGLTLDGRPVTDRLELEREAAIALGGLPAAAGDSIVLNTWYPRGPDEPDRAAVRIGRGIRQLVGYQQVVDLLEHEDLTAFSALAILAHGACDSMGAVEATAPFLARQTHRPTSAEVSWALPARTLPPLVVILACNSDRLELVEYASTLLKQGARCVLVPSGRIDAVRAAAFLSEFLRRWHAGVSVVDALRSLRADYLQNVLDRMWILGNGGLRHDTPATAVEPALFNDLPLEQLRRLVTEPEARVAAVAALADRATLLSIQRTGSLRDCIAILNDSLGIHVSSEESGLRGYRQLDEAYRECSLVTRSWLANYLLGLSERYDHDSIGRYRLDPVRDKGCSSTPILMHFAAVAEAREGHYLKSARSLRSGFDMLQDLGEDVPLDRIMLTGDVANNLIDFNLPDWALRLVRAQGDDLAHLDGLDAEFLEFTSLDREARALFRGGDVERALAAMRRKYRDAVSLGALGHRELAWLVYIAAWSPQGATPAHLDWVREATKAVADQQRSRGAALPLSLKGNDDLTYLLRALCAWNWARRDPSLTKFLEPWIDTSLDQIEGARDPGPWGFLAGYLAASGSAHANDAWPTARAHMLEWRYYLEVLGLEALRSLQRDDQQEILDQFHRTRTEMISILTPALQQPQLLGPAIKLEDELQSRYALERAGMAFLPTDTRTLKTLLVTYGLAPM